MANLFQAAKKKGKTPAAKKAEREEVVIKDIAFQNDLENLAKVNTEIGKLVAESKILTAEIKERAITEFKKLYKETGKFPGSFDIRGTAKGKKSASMMFLPTDRYLKIDEERAKELKGEFGNEIVEEETTYIMDTKLVEKYGMHISNLISKSKKITDDDKAKLISAVTNFTVTKGTIKDAQDYVTKGITLEHIIENIAPVYQMKNIKVDK